MRPLQITTCRLGGVPPGRMVVFSFGPASGRGITLQPIDGDASSSQVLMLPTGSNSVAAPQVIFLQPNATVLVEGTDFSVVPSIELTNIETRRTPERAIGNLVLFGDKAFLCALVRNGDFDDQCVVDLTSWAIVGWPGLASAVEFKAWQLISHLPDREQAEVVVMTWPHLVVGADA